MLGSYSFIRASELPRSPSYAWVILFANNPLKEGLNENKWMKIKSKDHSSRVSRRTKRRSMKAALNFHASRRPYREWERKPAKSSQNDKKNDWNVSWIPNVVSNVGFRIVIVSDGKRLSRDFRLGIYVLLSRRWKARNHKASESLWLTLFCHVQPASHLGNLKKMLAKLMRIAPTRNSTK